MYAPTARNTQSWQFIVIENKDILKKLSEIHPYGKMLIQSPLAILVVGDKILEKDEKYLAINGAAATQNLLLAAHALKIGSVWLGIYPKQERIIAISDFFKLPSEIIPISLVAFGYADETIPFPKRFNLNKVHYNNW